MSKRLKHVYKIAELAHIFFHQAEHGIDWGKCAGNMKFTSNEIYSYSSVIGIADFKKKVFLFRTGSYSSQTSKHQNHVYRAIPHDWKVYSWKNWYDFPNYKKFIQEKLDLLKTTKKSLYTCVKNVPINIYTKCIDHVTEFCNDLECIDLLPKFLEDAKQYEWTSEEVLMAEIKNWAVKNELLGSYESKKKKYLDPVLKALVEEQYSKNQSDKELAILKAKEKRAAKELEKLETWLNGSSYNFSYDMPIHLRLHNGEVQTTRGVTIPLEHCRLLYKKFRNCIATDTEYFTNGHSIHVGVYTVNSISLQSRVGTQPLSLEWAIWSGCHVIFQTEIEQFIERFNLQEWRK